VVGHQACLKTKPLTAQQVSELLWNLGPLKTLRVRGNTSLLLLEAQAWCSGARFGVSSVALTWESLRPIPGW
jgi:hypothetical protein